jgi:Asp-tRNA(Asn)/Glu-tRNA(Gln) amidotransferase A subunit family amidase
VGIAALIRHVPTYVKDNADVLGMPTGHGSAAFRAKPAGHTGPTRLAFAVEQTRPWRRIQD